ncbi:hypothetical protein Q5P01_000611 [Channa striata]|uniref:Uncharacterized protein n=1 Tax=Channa striata TaxID=64152 RepID=A0AA88IIR6_CHASR|nr:hypothetical protein Q5P01_000611 [Channa striata]
MSAGSRLMVKVHKITTAEAFDADEAVMKKVKNLAGIMANEADYEACDVVLLFCPIYSRVGSDVEAALSKVPQGDKPVILVVMHHTRDVDYSTCGTSWSERCQNVALDVHVLFHETMQGLLTCEKNNVAVLEIKNMLLFYSETVSKVCCEWFRNLFCYLCKRNRETV